MENGRNSKRKTSFSVRSCLASTSSLQMADKDTTTTAKIICHLTDTRQQPIPAVHEGIAREVRWKNNKLGEKSSKITSKTRKAKFQIKNEGKL